MKVYLIVGMSSTQYIVEADDAQPPPKAGDRYVARSWGHMLQGVHPQTGQPVRGVQPGKGQLELIVAERIDVDPDIEQLWVNSRAQAAGIVIPTMQPPRDVGKA